MQGTKASERDFLISKMFRIMKPSLFAGQGTNQPSPWPTNQQGQHRYSRANNNQPTNPGHPFTIPNQILWSTIFWRLFATESSRHTCNICNKQPRNYERIDELQGLHIAVHNQPNMHMKSWGDKDSNGAHRWGTAFHSSSGRRHPVRRACDGSKYMNGYICIHRTSRANDNVYTKDKQI